MVTVVLALAGCGASQPHSAAPSSAQLAKAFAGSPPPLSRLHAQANRLLFGGKSAFQGQLAALRGYPVVVNKWASWCAPCRGEFPLFQQAGFRLGKKVAFLGLDGNDNDGEARGFLKEYPVTYPSYSDPDVRIASAIQASVAFPTTVFFNPRGKLVYAHPGQYSKLSDLLTDIRRYAG